MIFRSDLYSAWKDRGFSGTPTIFSQKIDDALSEFIFDEEVVYFKHNGKLEPLLSLNDTHVKGGHNAENIMAALAIVWKGAGIPPTRAMAAVKSFKTGAHRMELFAENDGVLFINDSKSTTPDSTVAALRTYGGNHNVCLIAGGLDKEMDFSPLLGEGNRIKKAFLIGKCAGKLAFLLHNRIPYLQCASFEEAIDKSCCSAEAGDVVMLSPACASMDMFKNYIERGEIFKDIINRRLSR